MSVGGLKRFDGTVNCETESSKKASTRCSVVGVVGVVAAVTPKANTVLAKRR